MLSSPAQRLSILLVGCGSIGKRHARVLASLGATDIRACDPSADQLRSLLQEVPQVRPRDSFEAGLKDAPDAVFVLTPPKMHVPMILHALDAGCHVFCEKPLSVDLQGVDALDAQIRKTQRKVMIGLCFRYHEGMLKTKRALESGRIGRLVSVRSLMGEHLPEVRPDYRTLFTAKYSGAFDLTHDVDLALWFANQPVARVHAVFGSFSDIGIEAPDIVELLVGFRDRCVATVHLDFFQQPRRRQMELIGTEGVIIVEFASWDSYTLSLYSAENGRWEILTRPTRRDDMFAGEDREFLEAIAQDQPIRCGVAEARKSLEVILAAQQENVVIDKL
jgi:predicted dehydrogenase